MSISIGSPRALLGYTGAILPILLNEAAILAAAVELTEVGDGNEVRRRHR